MWRHMDQADFNGDGRPDVYSVSSRDRGLETYYSLGDGTPTIGKLRWRAAEVQWEIRDFNLDGAAGALVAYTGGCDDGSSGVVRIRDDGFVITLQHDPTGNQRWHAQATYVSGDHWPDIRTRDLDTGKIEYFIQVPDGSAHFFKSATAVQDKVTVSGDRAVNVPVLANDYATTWSTVSIGTPPKYGTVDVTSSRIIVYRPRTPHGDRLTYRVTDGEVSSIAPVNIRLTD